MLFFLALKLKLVQLSIKKPEKQEAQVVLLTETEQFTESLWVYVSSSVN